MGEGLTIVSLRQRLKQANAMLVQKSEQYIAERTAHEATRAQLAEAKEVLKPFAEVADRFDSGPIVNLYDEDGAAKAFIHRHAFDRARDFIGRMGK